MNIPTKINTLSFKRTDISIFKISGSSLEEMYVTPKDICVIDFGDGNKQTYTGNNTFTSVTHSYSESNIYTIKIIGNHSNFRASTNIIEIIQISNSITNYSYMFSNCSSLTAIPETLIIPNSVTNCSYMFSGCLSLTAIPETLTIPNSVTNCSYMFSSCRSLTSDISNIWPDVWNYTGTIDISYMFNSCSKVVGTIPADKLWNSNKTFNPSGCFYNCTNLTNYNEIPDTWK